MRPNPPATQPSARIPGSGGGKNYKPWILASIVFALFGMALFLMSYLKYQETEKRADEIFAKMKKAHTVCPHCCVLSKGEAKEDAPATGGTDGTAGQGD